MNLIEIDQQTCNKDGICAAVCPANLINFTRGSNPTTVDDIASNCIRCGHCVAACPTASVHHAEIPLKACLKIEKKLKISSKQSEQFLRSRRSIRNYRDKAVPKESLQDLIELARYAPSGHNTQSAEWLVITNREELNNLIVIVGDWMRWMLTNMSEFALTMNMDKALERLDAGEDTILRGAPALIVAHAAKEDVMAPVTCTIALTYLELAAKSMELGGCWAGYFNAAATNFPPMMEALGLPEGHQSFGAMMIGYPKFSYHRLPERKTPTITWR